MNRHLNDLEFLYRTLINNYGVPVSNITVLQYDGTLCYNDADWTRHQGSIGNWPGDNTPYQIKIDGAGTRENLLNAIAAVTVKLGPNDNLLIHTNNHGNTVAGTSTIISYSGEDTTPDDFSTAVGGLPKFSCFMVMMEQCYSGGFIQPIVNASPAACTSVATAVDANHESAGGADYDPFALDWIQAMAGTTPDGTALSPPVASGPPTAQQAFNYALETDIEYGDDPQFQASGGGENCTLAETVRWEPIPLIWKVPVPMADPSRPKPGGDRRIGIRGLCAGGVRRARPPAGRSPRSVHERCCRGHPGAFVPLASRGWSWPEPLLLPSRRCRRSHGTTQRPICTNARSSLEPFCWSIGIPK